MIPLPSVGSHRRGGSPISQQHNKGHDDFERLERAVRSLVERYLGARRENASLRRELEEAQGRVAALDGEVFELNQRRQDVSKRIDELISQLDHLDAQFESPGSG